VVDDAERETGDVWIGTFEGYKYFIKENYRSPHLAFLEGAKYAPAPELPKPHML